MFKRGKKQRPTRTAHAMQASATSTDKAHTKRVAAAAPMLANPLDADEISANQPSHFAP